MYQFLIGCFYLTCHDLLFYNLLLWLCNITWCNNITQQKISKNLFNSCISVRSYSCSTIIYLYLNSPFSRNKMGSPYYSGSLIPICFLFWLFFIFLYFWHYLITIKIIVVVLFWHFYIVVVLWWHWSMGEVI